MAPEQELHVRPWQARFGCFAGRDRGSSRGGGGQREALVQQAHALAAERRRSEAAADKDAALELGDVEAAEGADSCPVS